MKNLVSRSVSPVVSLVFTLSAGYVLADEKESADAASKLEEVRVVGHPLSAEGLAQASVVLAGAELDRKLQGSIGETIAHEPGIHSASFGEAVGRPVIHGQSGARVRIMEDRIDTMDVSVTSGDHATTIEPFIADRIEVLKGASTLLYGSGAIGGVVDVHTGRIPHEVPGKPVAGRAELRYADNGGKVVGAARLDGGAGNFAWHVDGFGRDADDYDIPDFAESARLRALEEAEHEEEHAAEEEHGEEEVRGVLPGSGLEVQGGAVGVSYVMDNGFAGFAVSRLEATYGLPGGHGHEEEHEEEGEEHGEEEGNPILDMEQTRVDFELGLEDPLTGFASLNLRAGVNDYEHSEIEPSGEVATLFENDALEARIELVHEAIAGWNGALGLQFSDREFSAVGEEAFIEPVDTQTFGAFWVGERDVGFGSLETGLRLETVSHEPSDAMLADTDFDTFSVSAGLVIPFQEDWRVTLRADHSTRAPVGEELYSDGAHLATQTYELGNPGLDEEQATSLTATLGYYGERWMLSSTVYHIDYSDYIYQRDTGLILDDLPALQYQQVDAKFSGFEAEMELQVGKWGSTEVGINAMFDTVFAELDVAGNDDPPRVPPTRFGFGIGLVVAGVEASIDYLRVAEQDDTAPLELVTDAYDDVRLYLGSTIDLNGQQLTLFLKGMNLTDDEQRNHTSFIKDFAPRPGRTVEAGARLRF